MDEMNKKINWKSGSFKCITFLLLIGCLLAIHVFAPGVTENLCHLARGGNLKAVSYTHLTLPTIA